MQPMVALERLVSPRAACDYVLPISGRVQPVVLRRSRSAALANLRRVAKYAFYGRRRPLSTLPLP
jgi:hypothetical protein